MATYRRGMKGDDVRTLQRQLQALGHYQGPIDGDFGPGTEAAVRAFQQAQGLDVDGIVGPNTQRAVEAATATPPAPPSATFRSGSSGEEVRAIQERLKVLGLYRGPVDGDFGGGTLGAVKAFQRSNGLGTDGIVGPNTWRALFDAPAPEPAILGQPLGFRCLALTGAFENGQGFPDCFAGLSGDFDNQGISFGVLQWNFGQESLQPLLEEMFAEHRDVMRDVFQNHVDTLEAVLDEPHDEQMAFVRSIQHPVRHTVYQPWQGMLKTLGRTPAFQAIQVRHADGLFDQALALCDEYALWSERATALMFDIKVQNGSIRRVVKTRIEAEFGELPDGLSREESEVRRMRIVANLRAEASNPRWVEDVRARKLCCANGEGTVHGVPFDVAAQFGIRLMERQAA